MKSDGKGDIKYFGWGDPLPLSKIEQEDKDILAYIVMTQQPNGAPAFGCIIKIGIRTITIDGCYEEKIGLPKVEMLQVITQTLLEKGYDNVTLVVNGLPAQLKWKATTYQSVGKLQQLWKDSCCKDFNWRRPMKEKKQTMKTARWLAMKTNLKLEKKRQSHMKSTNNKLTNGSTKCGQKDGKTQKSTDKLRAFSKNQIIGKQRHSYDKIEQI